MSICDGCGDLVADGELEVVRRPGERVDPGGVVPSGQCPGCGALCYPGDEFSVELRTDDIFAANAREAVEEFQRVVQRGGRSFTVTDSAGCCWLVHSDTGEVERAPWSAS